MTVLQVRLSRCNNVSLLNRAARLFLVWGDRKMADAAHVRSRQASVENLMRKLSERAIG